jgi:hypothetical protein
MADLNSLLEDYGWSFRQLSHSQWQTGFKADSRTFTLQIEVSEHFVSFQLPLLSASDRDLAALLHTLNQDMRILRLVLTSEGCVDLVGDVPRHGFDNHVLELVLGLYGYFTGSVYRRCVSEAYN